MRPLVLCLACCAASFGAAPPFADPSLPEGAIGVLTPPKASDASWVQALAFRPDGKVLVSASADGVRYWHLPTGRVQRFIPRQSLARGGDVLLDGRGHLALFLPHGTESPMHAYDLRLSRPLPEIKVKGTMQAVALSRDGSIIARADHVDDRRIVLRAWRTDTGRKVMRRSFDSLEPKGCSLCLSPDGALLAAQLADASTGGVYSGLLRVKTGAEVARLPERPVLAMAFSGGGGSLALVRNGSVELRDGRTGKSRREFQVPGLRAESAVFSPDGRTVALSSPGSRETKVEVLELASGQVRSARKDPTNGTGWGAAAFSPRGGRLATAGKAGAPVIWDTTGRADLRGGAGAGSVAGLSSRSGDEGHEAMGQLLRSPERAVPLMRNRFRPSKAPPSEDKIEQLLALADDRDPDFSRAAKAALVDAGHLSLSPLRVARAEANRPDKRAGIGRMIEEINQPFSQRTIRETRAVEVLERLGTPAAVRLIKELAAGHPGTDLTREARAALSRMEKP